jgi:two-component system phosphate regulon response regulator PhoB
MKILLVDDDPVIGAILSDYLAAHGHKLEVMTSGKEAIEQINHGTQSPDILLLDLVMPDMNGIDVLQKLKADHKTESLPVILLSANADSDELLDGYEHKADHYLSKPFNIKRIIDLISEVGPK